MKIFITVALSWFLLAATKPQLCDLLVAEQGLQNIKSIIAKEPVIESHPWGIRIGTALLTKESRKFRTVLNPLLRIRGGAEQGSKILFPVSKEEPIFERVMMFLHMNVEKAGSSFAPNVRNGEDITKFYRGELPHPGMLDYYREKVLLNLYQSYEEQKLPGKAWKNIFMDEFALASHRSFEVIISHKNEFRGYARLYMGTSQLGVEKQLYGPQNPVTNLFSLEFAAGVYPFQKTPVERLLTRFHIAENPIEKLRTQFPNHDIVEIGRLLVEHDAPPSVRETSKNLLMTNIIQTLKEISRDKDLSKVILVASAGPFGARRYPTEFGMNKIFEVRLDEKNLVNDVPEGTEQRGDLRIQFNWSPDYQKAAANDKIEDIRDLVIFAATADVVEHTLTQRGALMSDVPVLDRFPFISYDSALDLRVN